MRKFLLLLIVACQVAIVGFFLSTKYDDNYELETNVSTVHNENLNKIATSVSLLFKDEEVDFVSDIVDDTVL